MFDFFAYPNPFNPSTNISYYINRDGYIKLSVYNISGQKIEELANGFKYPGEYSVSFEGKSLSGGIYIIHLQNDQQHLTKKRLLFR